MKRSTLALVLLAVLCLAATATVLAAETWVHLGTRRVTDRVERDVIVVGADEGLFSAIQIRVGKVAIQFRSVTVHFVNGKEQQVELRQVIPAGGQSRAIDLVGEDRRIRSVEFRYDAQSFGRRGVVRLFGRR